MQRPALAALVTVVAAAFSVAGSAGGASSPPDSSVYYQMDDDGRVERVAIPSRSYRNLQMTAPGPPSATISHALADPDTIYNWFNHGFDVLTGGLCKASGWTGQERSGLLFAHVDNKHLKNDAFVTMGTKAVWFGTDLATDPAEVSNWNLPEGFGSQWSQRLTSPTFTNGDYRLVFDGQAGLALGGPQAGVVNRFLAVQGLLSDGKWGVLIARWVFSSSPLLTTAAGVQTSGTETFHCFVPTHPDSQGGFAFASPTQIRIVFQSPSTITNEDGGLPLQDCPGAIVDNVVLDDLNSATDVIPLQDFESGGTGVWTLLAKNGGLASGGGTVIKDGPLPNPNVSIQSGVDPIDPTCVWQLAGAGGYVEDRTWTRITSPWIPWEAGSDTAFSVVYRGTGTWGGTTVGRFMSRRVLGKRAGDTYAHRMWGRTAIIFFFAGSSDLDVAAVDLGFPYAGSFTVNGSVTACDSIRFFWEVTDYCDRFSINTATRTPTRHPILDDIRIVQFHEDADFDGVRNSQDPCPACAAGQDADGDGCVDTTATLRHVESWPATASPIHFRLSQNGDPSITDGSDLQAMRDAFAAWAAVPGANVQLVEHPVTVQTNASATDGINLLTFEDDYAFPGNVLAITPTLSYTKRTSYDDRMRLPGEIVDADIMFNPAATFRTATAGPPSGSFDLESVAVHEIGHFLGLSHSGVADATMYPVLQSGTLAASLESDDQSAIAAAYPGATLLTGYGWINGRVTRGSNGSPIPGALVLGVRLDGGGAPQDTVASDYTDEDGYYHLFRLPAGNYAVRVLPLDGTTPGVVPGAINARVYATAQTNFQPEWYGGPESNSDDPDMKQSVAVSAGSAPAAVNIVSNIDVTPPTVVSVSPADLASDVRIDTPLLVTFSESIEASTLSTAFKLHTVGGSGTLGGHGDLITPGLSFVFVPDNPLAFSTSYELQITTALQDVQGNPIAATYTTTFTTQDQPPVSVSDVSPRQAPVGALVTITGAGYNAAAENRVFFTTNAGYAGYVLGTHVTPTTMVAEVPADAVTGPMKVEVVGAPDPTSNEFTFSLLTSSILAPSPNGDAVAVGFPPVDVALSPDAKTAFVLGAEGFARINLDPLKPFYRIAKPAQPALLSGSQLALLPSGVRGYVSRPDDGDVVEVDTDPASGSFGNALATVTIPGRPDAIVAASSGRRIYVADQSADVIYEVDADLGSATFHHILREITVPGAVFTGGIAMDARRDRVVLATRNLGVVSVDLDTTSIITTVSTSPAAGSIALAPGGNRVLATSPDPDPSQVVFGSPVGSPAAGSADVGGDARDVVVHPDGATAFVANSVLGRLQILDVTQTTPVLVANVAAGSSPVAVAVSAGGTLAATADYAGQTVSFFNVVGTATPVRATPPVATAGDQVSVAAAGGVLTGGTLVDVGTGDLAAVHAVSSAVSFNVPAGEQRSTSVTLINGGVRSVTTPLEFVDPITVLDPRATGLTLDPQNVTCGGSVDGALERVVVSPDGERLAVTREGPSCAFVDVYQVVPNTSTPFGTRLINGATFAGASVLHDIAFTPDSKKLWVASDAGGLFELDVELATVLPFGGGTVGTAHSLASDPMGRYVVVGTTVSPGVNQIQLWSPSRTLGNSVSVTGEVNAIAVSPDGHYAIAGAEGRAHVIDLSVPSLLTSTPLHVVTPPDRITSVAVTTDGQRAAGLFPGNRVAIWNLNPLSGAVGAELFYDVSSLSGTISQLVPAPDGDAMLAGCRDCNSLFKFEPDNPPPGGNGPLPGSATYAMGQPSRALARSADGRTLWAANWTDGTLVGDIRPFTLTRGTTLALVSGEGQSASPSQVLPLPVRVHLISDSDGHDAVGALVRFTLASAAQGGLDGSALDVVKPTGMTGEAEVTWTMPGTATPVSMSVTALGVTGTTFTVNAEAVADPSVAAPAVVAVGPANGSTGIDAGTSIFVRFSQKMDATSVDSNAVLTVNGASAVRTIQFEDDHRSVFIQPSAPLPYGATVSISLQNMLDQEGQQLPTTFTSSFTVESPPTLAIASVSPPSAPPGTPITINGDGFNAVISVNSVSFNGQASPVTSATTGALVTSVPASATSGPLTVTVGANTTVPVPFNVLSPNPTPLEVGAESNVHSGIEAIAITPDARRAYITMPSANCVLAYDLVQRTVLKNIPVGLKPQAIAVTPDGDFAYVANSRSDNVSVIDINPESPTYHKTLGGPAYPIKVGDKPKAIVASAFGPSILVVNSGDSTVSLIDADPRRGTYDRVTKTINAGSGVTSIVISADGTRAYLASSGGILVVDVAEGAVTKTINVGSGATTIAISADGTILFALGSNGYLNLIDIVDGSTTFNEVTKTINVGSGASSIAISADGTLLYLTLQDANLALAYQILHGGTGGPGGSTTPGEPADLVLADSIAVGEGPGAIAMFPNGAGGVVVNEASGSVTILAAAGVVLAVEPQPALPAELQLRVSPTPSHGAAAVRFALPKRTAVELSIFDIQGRLVRQLVNESMAPGWHTVPWRGEGRNGTPAGTGVYLLRMRAEGRVLLKRIIWLR